MNGLDCIVLLQKYTYNKQVYDCTDCFQPCSKSTSIHVDIYNSKSRDGLNSSLLESECREELQVYNSVQHSQATKPPLPASSQLATCTWGRPPHPTSAGQAASTPFPFSLPLKSRTNKLMLHKRILQSHALHVAADGHPTRLRLLTPRCAPLAQKLKTAKSNKISFLTYPFPPINH
jgi:hypothetical protein